MGREYGLPLGRLRLACRLAAAAWVVLSLAFLLQPAALSPGISFPMELTVDDIAAFWEARPDQSPVHVGLHASALVAALITLGVVASVAGHYRQSLRWSSALAALGLATTAISNVRYLALEPVYARLHAEAAPGAVSAIAVASASLALDPWGILEFGMLAIWLVAVTMRVTPRRRALSVAGGVGALGFVGMVVGSAVWPPALDVAPFLGTPGLVAWLLLLPGSLSSAAHDPA